MSKGTPLGIAVRDNATAWLLGGARGWLLLPCPFPGTELSCILRPHSRRPLARPVCPAQAGPFLVACSALELQLIPGDLALSKDRRPGLGCWDRAVAVTAVPVLARVTPGAARGPATPSVHPLVPGGSLWAPLTAAPVALQQCPNYKRQLMEKDRGKTLPSRRCCVLPAFYKCPVPLGSSRRD